MRMPPVVQTADIAVNNRPLACHSCTATSTIGYRLFTTISHVGARCRQTGPPSRDTCPNIAQHRWHVTRCFADRALHRDGLVLISISALTHHGNERGTRGRSHSSSADRKASETGAVARRRASTTVEASGASTCLTAKKARVTLVSNSSTATLASNESRATLASDSGSEARGSRLKLAKPATSEVRSSHLPALVSSEALVVSDGASSGDEGGTGRGEGAAGRQSKKHKRRAARYNLGESNRAGRVEVCQSHAPQHHGRYVSE